MATKKTYIVNESFRKRFEELSKTMDRPEWTPSVKVMDYIKSQIPDGQSYEDVSRASIKEWLKAYSNSMYVTMWQSKPTT